MNIGTRLTTYVLGLLAPLALIAGMVSNGYDVDRKVEAMNTSAAMQQVASR